MASGGVRVMSRPARAIEPLWAGLMPISARIRVVLPTPLRPSTTPMPPASTDSDTPCSTMAGP
jgi:hypothetical protein